jgi:hypothetical protein
MELLSGILQLSQYADNLDIRPFLPNLDSSTSPIRLRSSTGLQPGPRIRIGEQTSPLRGSRPTIQVRVGGQTEEPTNPRPRGLGPSTSSTSHRTSEQKNRTTNTDRKSTSNQTQTLSGSFVQALERLNQLPMPSTWTSPTMHESNFFNWIRSLDTKTNGPTNASSTTVVSHTEEMKRIKQYAENLTKLRTDTTYAQKFREWSKLYYSHTKCCNVYHTGNESELMRSLHVSVVNLPHVWTDAEYEKNKTDAASRLEMVQMSDFRGKHIHVSAYEFQKCQLWQELPFASVSSSVPNNGNGVKTTLYVNWTNRFQPGMGFVGCVPEKVCDMIDEDELALFHQTNLFMYLQPEHPTLLENQFLPLDPLQMLYCKSVLVYQGTQSTTAQCKTKQMDVVSVALVKQKFMDEKSIIGEAEQKRILGLVFHNLTQICAAIGAKQIIIPMGRLMRMGFDPFIVGHAFARAFLPMFTPHKRERSTLHNIELLLPPSSSTRPNETSERWVNTITSILHMYEAQIRDRASTSKSNSSVEAMGAK